MSVLNKEDQSSDNDTAMFVGSKNVQSASNNSLKPKKDKTLGIVVALVIVLAGIGLVIFIRHNHQNSSTISNSKSFAQVKLTGDGAGRGMTFIKPSDLFRISGQDTKNIKGFIKLSKSPKNHKALAGLSRIFALAKDLPDSELPADKFANKVKQAIIAGPRSADYQQKIGFVQGLTKLEFPESTITVVYGNAQTFTNPNIKDNAWQSDITAIDSSQITPTLRGKLVCAIGKMSRYCLLVTTVADDWQNNAGYWKKITDSIKIDQ